MVKPDAEYRINKSIIRDNNYIGCVHCLNGESVFSPIYLECNNSFC